MRAHEFSCRASTGPNIRLRVDHFKTEAEKRDALVHRVRWADKPGIVYTATRKAAEEIKRIAGLRRGGRAVLSRRTEGKDRHAIQERFMAGEAEVMVATNAFGMGVDKADIRFVYHHDPCDSLDSYYQEIGRAGRDGKQADATLFYRRQDIGAQSFKTGEGRLDTDVLERVLEHVAGEPEPVDPGSLAKEVGLSTRKLTTAVQRLEDAGALETLPTGEVKAVESADLKRRSKGRPRAGMRRRGSAIVCKRCASTQKPAAAAAHAPAELPGRYFEGPCGNCDNCDATGNGNGDQAAGTRREVVE